MNWLRWHMLPHLLFIALLGGVSGTGAWRIRLHVVELERTGAALQQAMGDAEQVDRLYLALLHAEETWRAYAADATTERELAFGLAFQQWRLQTRLAGSAASPLRESVYLHQLQLLVAAEAERLVGGPPPLTEPPRWLTMAGLWSDLNRQVWRETNRQSQAVLRRQLAIIREASVLCGLLVVMAVLYLYAVNAYLRRPVERLADAARAVRRGRLEARAEVAVDGPVGDLAKDFNRMVDRLVESLVQEERMVAELRAKARQLEEANRHKNQFLANVSHELKTPLNAILGFADILESELHGPVTARQREYLRRMAQAGHHLLAMISDLIDVAKLDLGALALTDQEFAPGELLREVGELLAPQVAAKRHRLTLSVPPELPPLLSDRHRVQQILVNLLANAIKFTPEGGELELAVAAAEPGWLRWSVRDNGIGIAAADQAAIFEDFVQLDSQLHRQHEGTGIGLALCRRLARLLGGEIAVTSAPGSGSTFTVRLPLRRPSPPVPGPPPGPAAK